MFGVDGSDGKGWGGLLSVQSMAFWRTGLRFMLYIQPGDFKFGIGDEGKVLIRS